MSPPAKFQRSSFFKMTVPGSRHTGGASILNLVQSSTHEFNQAVIMIDLFRNSLHGIISVDILSGKKVQKPPKPPKPSIVRLSSKNRVFNVNEQVSQKRC